MAIREESWKTGFVRVTNIVLDVFNEYDPDQEAGFESSMNLLTVSIKELTKTGNLTLEFNKPILTPAIKVNNET